MNSFTLENTSKKYTCPSCGQKRFVHYISTADKNILNEQVGRCDRESSCGYHFKPKEFFALNNTDNFRANKRTSAPNASGSFKPFKNYGYAQTPPTKPPDYIPREYLFETLGGYENNAFIKFLLSLFPESDVEQAVIDYSIGTFNDYAVFPVITRSGKVAQGKLMKFDAGTGKRLRNDKFSISSLPYELKKLGKLKGDFETDKSVFFGEHLTKDTTLKIGIVEAQKTAVICSILMPDKIWLASGSKSFVKTEKLRKFRHREIILYPDGDGFELWTETAHLARLDGLDVKVSRLIEDAATAEQKKSGVDLADLLIGEMKSGKAEKQNRQKQDTFSKTDVSISDFIKRLQMSGVKFYLSPTFFETSGRALSQTERENQQANAGRVLCQLQQAVIENKIFKSFPDIREQFKFEVLEREAILIEADEPNAEYKAIRQTAFIWFHDYFLEGVLN